MVTRLFGDSRLCNVDTVRTVDLQSGFQTGVVFLGETLPPIALVGGAVTLVGVMVVVRFDDLCLGRQPVGGPEEPLDGGYRFEVLSC